MSKHHTQKKPLTNRVGSSMNNESASAYQKQNDEARLDEGFTPSYEEIQKKAYQLHEEKGGSDLDNWLEAERVLKAEHSS